MDVGARPAVVEDASEVAALEAAARAAVAGERGGPELLAGSEPATTAQWASRIAGEDAWYVAVGTLDAVVLGYAAAQLRNGVATVHHLFVVAEVREVGIGEALIECLLSWASAAGAIALEATALPGDRQTKNLFERFGMKARAITVSRRLV